MTVTVRHPHLPGVTRTVPAADLPRWTAQGWLPPETPAKSPARARQTTTRTRRRRSTSTTTGSES